MTPASDPKQDRLKSTSGNENDNTHGIKVVCVLSLQVFKMVQKDMVQTSVICVFCEFLWHKKTCPPDQRPIFLWHKKRHASLRRPPGSLDLCKKCLYIMLKTLTPLYSFCKNSFVYQSNFATWLFPHFGDKQTWQNSINFTAPKVDIEYVNMFC